MDHTITDTLLDILVNRHTAVSCFADIQKMQQENGYVPTIHVYHVGRGFSGEHAQLVKGLTERGIKVWTGEIEENEAELEEKNAQ